MGEVSILSDIKTNQFINLEQEGENQYQPPQKTSVKAIFQKKDIEGLDYRHEESGFVDFNRNRLLHQMVSTEGPTMAVIDVNGDGFEDVFVGGAKGQSAALYVWNKKGFTLSNQEVFEKDKISEDTDCSFFDIEGDGDMDLYVASGSNEFPSSSSALRDRIYLNDGKGNFQKAEKNLITYPYMSTACVAVADYDKDGDIDVFVGERLKPFSYGLPVSGYLWQNDGNGNFRNVTEDIASELKKIGLIRDAVWADIDGDTYIDLVVVGEYMPVEVFLNKTGKLVRSTDALGLSNTKGLWNTVSAFDIDNDGDMDLMAGNHGLNSRFKASVQRPLKMYVHDFDKNGSIEQMICIYEGDTSYPITLRHDLIKQMPILSKKYLKFKDYAGQRVEDMFDKEVLDKASVLEAYTLETSLYLNENAKFKKAHLPVSVQFSPVYAIDAFDYNKDGHLDLILGGNFYRAKPETGIYDASYGTLLLNTGRSSFIDHTMSIKGEIRHFQRIKIDKEIVVLTAKNNDSLEVYSFKKTYEK